MLREDISDDGFVLPVLGTDYTVKSWTNKDHPDFFLEKCGECDGPAKKITIENLLDTHETESDETSCPEEFMNQTLRHELIHAFFFENGIGSESRWACDEVLVDWLALQMPKLITLFMQAKAFTEDDLKRFEAAFKQPNRQAKKTGKEKKADKKSKKENKKIYDSIWPAYQ